MAKLRCVEVRLMFPALFELAGTWKTNEAQRRAARQREERRLGETNRSTCPPAAIESLRAPVP